jgi:hypothetical protein
MVGRQKHHGWDFASGANSQWLAIGWLVFLNGKLRLSVALML